MNQLKMRLKDGMSIFWQSHKVYKKLQKHLDKQPVGFPATVSGVELRLLRDAFTVKEAELALELDYKFQSFEDVFEKVKDRGIYEADLQAMLDNMESHGAIFVKIVDGKKQYALHPFAVGIFEMKVPTMNASYYMDFRKYVYQSFAMAFLSTPLPQMRVIPVEKSVTPDLNIATYDEVRELVLQNDGHIALAECVCRKGKDSIGRPCMETDRREVCIGFGDFADMYTRNGFGWPITKEEAFEILAQNEKDGLVLMPSNSQEAQFVCSCCKCCCACLEGVSMLAKPAEFVKNNYYAVLDAEKCIECGKCGKKCKMEAIKMQQMEDGKKVKAIAIDLKRCIGCGVCVAACKSGALTLAKKDKQTAPPKDMDTLYEEIMKQKKGTAKRTLHMGRKVIGF
ncbi:MAG: 4Fe-4S dicluster domain-containing protein [Desulfobacteraceae bacterium]|nr:4Fe-4S dicluster domain-containing protein [Desulfobacteraceae bacterium]MBC2756820.1 4Fe-4S dicluster domain-containing protein [Desulfobacteraceae bacterium]